MSTRYPFRTLRFVYALGLMLAVPALSQTPTSYSSPHLVCVVQANFINEASGIAVSHANPGIFWLHNDSGDGPYLYAVDSSGRTKGVFQVRQATAIDWEDMAIGPGPDGKGSFVYIGDIGDNKKKRPRHCIYRFAEPRISPVVGTKDTPNLTSGETICRTYQYPDGIHNAEALLCHPKTGALYIVSKEESGVSGVYKFPMLMSPGAIAMLEKVGSITIPEEQSLFPRLVTGGDISPDGKRVALQTYDGIYELRLPVNAPDFDTVWQQKFTRIEMAPLQQAEAICYSLDGKSLYQTSEKRPTPIFELKSL